MKYVGYDGLVVRGRAGKPVYLCIKNNTVEVRDALSFWGKTTFEAFDILKAELEKGVRIEREDFESLKREYYELPG
ncbi:aldehyde ferredoxin oxidoreductase N-terminal domain-containing protein [Chloroflexota bacterium]